MQGFWETYMKSVDGYPAMLSFNATVSQNAPDEEYGYVAFVKVKLKSPTDEGLISQEDVDEVGFIEDRLELESLRYRHGEYVGRIITQGHINFIYYLKMDFEWSDTVAAAMGYFEDYTFELGSRLDSEWEVYQKLLFPTAREWQIIQNHHACDELKNAGDNLKLKRAIEHTMYFPTPQERELFGDFIQNEEFKLQKNLEPSEEIPFYGVKFYRIDVPFYRDIDKLTMELIDHSEKFNGQYDGWETSLVKI
ncbi:DUF695 domain-containing protein [Sulfurimonas sp. HSL-1716]|uniref:DUF695 domain-containing protein n=1 Tax=Hydrocurvibacter sulfurireducens TaxID=3131937 RepID=UPI0031F8A0AC